MGFRTTPTILISALRACGPRSIRAWNGWDWRQWIIFFVHDSDFKGQHTDEDFIEALEAAVELRAKGTVKAIGMGMNEWERTGRMVERFDLDYILLAGRYTLLDQSALPEFLPLCVERGVKLTMGGPYNSGILARDLSQPVSFDYLARA